MAIVDDISRRFARSPIMLAKFTVRSTVPAAAEGFGSPTLLNKAMPARATASDGDLATKVPVGIAPLQSITDVGSYIVVKVSGIQVEVGDAVKTKDCYFSGDAGVTARAIQDIQQGDFLRWNGSIAGYELLADMKVDFLYYEFVEGSDDLTPDTVFHFSPKDARPMTLQLGVDVRPYLLSAEGRATRIKPDQALTERTVISLTFHEDEDAPALPSDRFVINSGGGFFRRLIAAQPDLIGTQIEVLRGFDEPGFALSDFVRVFKGRWEDHNFQVNGNITIVAKDDLALNDREIPAQISDTNLLAGDLTTSSTTIPVDDVSEFTDPVALPSQDFVPLTVRIETEDIIIKKRRLVTNELVVQDQNIDKSEELDSLPWKLISTTSVIAETGIGPFGGLARADTLVLPFVGAGITQPSTRIFNEVANWTYAVWLRATAVGGVGTITIQVQGVSGLLLKSNQVTLTNSWQRFDVTTGGILFPTATPEVLIRRAAGDVTEVEVWGNALYEGLTPGFYVFTDGNDGVDAGRGAFQTTAATHTTGDDIIEVGVYQQQNEDQGVHPVMALRDLVNRGDIAVADVDQSTFDREQDFIPSSQVKRAGLNAIIEPEKLSTHIKELREQSLLDLWVSETGLVRTRLSFRVNLPGSTLPKFTDETGMLRRSASTSGNAASRVTRMQVYFDQIADTAGKDREDFNKVQVTLDAGVEALSGPKTKSILARWIFRDQDAVAVAGRTVSRFRRGAQIYKFQLDLKDVPDFDVADLVRIDTTDFLKGSGSQAIRDSEKVWQVVQRVYNHKEGTVRIEALEANGRKFAIISPSPFPDFPVATATERQFGFIGDSDNLVNVGTEEGYFIL